MSGTAGLVLCPEARGYDHGPQHPLRPQRVLYTWSLIEACGLLERPNVSRLSCRAADDGELGLVHTDAYIDATSEAPATNAPASCMSRKIGLSPGPNPNRPQAPSSP